MGQHKVKNRNTFQPGPCTWGLHIRWCAVGWVSAQGACRSCLLVARSPSLGLSWDGKAKAEACRERAEAHVPAFRGIDNFV
jgi:hypothetical protein